MNCQICESGAADVNYFDCCEHYYGTPMCYECAYQPQGATYSCDAGELEPLPA